MGTIYVKRCIHTSQSPLSVIMDFRILFFTVLAGSCICWSVDLGLQLDSALQRDGSLPASRNTGGYLKDSFRTEILTPAFSTVVKAIEKNRQEDSILETALFCLFGGLAIIVLYLLYIMRFRELKIKESVRFTPR